MMDIRRRRGQPAIAMAALVLGWIGLRGVMLAAGPVVDPALKSEPAMLARVEAGALPGGTLLRSKPAGHEVPAITVIRPPSLLLLAAPVAQVLQAARRGRPLPMWTPPAPQRPLRAGLAAFRTVAGHQLLYAAAFSSFSPPFNPMPLPARQTNRQTPGRTTDRSRWSFDGWLLWRGDASREPAPAFGNSSSGASFGASYGASQAGLVLRYRLDPGSDRDPMLFVRGTRAVASPHDPELAAGLQVQPLLKVPLHALVEARFARSGGQDRVRLAAGVISAVNPVALPSGFRADPYVQAGYVSGAGGGGFVDGQLRIDRRIARLGSAELRAGGGAWGAIQTGANRLDLGPGVTLHLPLGRASARLSADWRARVAGNALPGSGLAITLATGF